MIGSCWSPGSQNPGQNLPTARVWWGCAAPTAGPRTLLLPPLLMPPPAWLPRGCQRNGCFTLSTSLRDLQTHPVDCVQIMCQQQLLPRALRKDIPNLCVVLVVGYMLLMWEAHRGVFPSYSKGFRYSVVEKKPKNVLYLCDPDQGWSFWSFVPSFLIEVHLPIFSGTPSIFANIFLYLFLYMEKVFSMISMW